MGATQKALVHGVPVCMVPFGRDQLEVARRVEVAKAGARLPVKKLSPDLLQAKVREAIACKEGAQRIASFFSGFPVGHRCHEINSGKSKGAKKDFIVLYALEQHGVAVTSLIFRLPDKFSGSSVNYYHIVSSVSYSDAHRDSNLPLLALDSDDRT